MSNVMQMAAAFWALVLCSLWRLVWLRHSGGPPPLRESRSAVYSAQRHQGGVGGPRPPRRTAAELSTPPTCSRTRLAQYLSEDSRGAEYTADLLTYKTYPVPSGNTRTAKVAPPTCFSTKQGQGKLRLKRVSFIITWRNFNSSKSAERFGSFARQTYIAVLHTTAP
jgi:hypothetical protein